MGKTAEVTRHANKRLRERSGIPKKAVQRTAQLALDAGYKHSDTKGALNTFMSSLYLREKKANNMRVFGDKVYLFHDSRLITVLQIPQQIMRNIDRFIKEEAK